MHRLQFDHAALHPPPLPTPLLPLPPLPPPPCSSSWQAALPRRRDGRRQAFQRKRSASCAGSSPGLLRTTKACLELECPEEAELLATQAGKNTFAPPIGTGGNRLCSTYHSCTYHGYTYHDYTYYGLRSGEDCRQLFRRRGVQAVPRCEGGHGGSPRQGVGSPIGSYGQRRWNRRLWRRLARGQPRQWLGAHWLGLTLVAKLPKAARRALRRHMGASWGTAKGGHFDHAAAHVLHDRDGRYAHLVARLFRLAGS